MTAENPELLTLEVMKGTLLKFLGPGKLGITEDMIIGFTVKAQNQPLDDSERRRMARRRRLLAVTLTVEVIVRASMAELQLNSASELQNTIAKTLSAAVSDGSFTEELASECGGQCGAFSVSDLQTEGARAYP